MSVLVIGARTGLGRRLVRSLLRRGCDVTVLTEQAAADRRAAGVLRDERVRVEVGDASDPDRLRRAACGAKSVFVLTPHSQQQVAVERTVVDVAADIGARLVKVSCWAPLVRPDSPLTGGRHNWAIQQHIRARADVGHTILYPNYLMQSFARLVAPTVRRQAILPDPLLGCGISMVAAEDVAEVAAVALTDPSHEGRRYTLTGPSASRGRDLAETLTDLGGRPVECRPIGVDALLELTANTGGARRDPDECAAVLDVYRHGLAELVTDDVRAVTGRPPRSITQFLRANRRSFLASAPAAHP
jgi:uncharacterized protein YbjT (DUF2867 family)